MGGKRGIAYELMLAMVQRHPNAKYFFDMFGGGGSMSMMALQFGFKVNYNEFCSHPYTVLKYVWENGVPAEWWGWVSREDFADALTKDDPRSCMIRYVWSFGNNGRDYMFGADREELKRLCHAVVVFRDKDALNKVCEVLGIKLRIPAGATVTARAASWHRQLNIVRKGCVWEIKQLEQLEQDAGRMQQLERLTFTNLSYDAVEITTPPEETIVYCDPPYRSTRGYVSNGQSEGVFSTEYFDNWVRNCPYPVYISEYSAPFEKIFSLLKREMLNSARTGDKNLKSENLYWNGVRAGLAEASR